MLSEHTLATGESFSVEITRAPLSADDARHWCALRARAFGEFEMPAFTHTVALAALATGQTTIDTVLSQMTAEAIEQFRNFVTAQRLLAEIPHGE